MNISFYCLWTLVLMCLTVGSAEAQEPVRRTVVISAGMAVPYSDGQFYDYWKNGYGVRAELYSESTGAISASGSVDLLWFGLDSDRFFRRMMVTADAPSHSGGWKSVMTVDGVMRYRVPGYTTVQPSIFAGAGIQHVYRAEMEIDYPFAPQTAPGVSLLSVVIPFGASVRFPYKNIFDLQLDLHHVFPVTGSSKHGYSGVRLGIVLPTTL